MSRRRIATVAAVGALAGAVASPGTAYGYTGEYRQNGTDVEDLCSFTQYGAQPIVPIGFGWDMGTVHGTDDWNSGSSTPLKYVSFRTCEWVGTNHDYRYKCSTAYDTWNNQLVRFDTGTRDTNSFTSSLCDGTEKQIYWNQHSHNSSARIHWHLHSYSSDAPSHDHCPDEIQDSDCHSGIKVTGYAASVK